MAEFEQPNDPNKIDINLSLLSGQSGIAFDKFIKELEAIRKGLAAATNLSNPAGAARSHADFYTRGYSTQGSRSTGDPTRAERVTSESAGSSNAGRDMTDQHFEALRKQSLLDAARGGFSTGGLTGAFRSIEQRAQLRNPVDPHDTAGSRATDEENAAGMGGGNRYRRGGGAGGGSGRSSGASVPQNWHEGIDPSVVNSPIDIPRAGEFTAQDAATIIANQLGKRALKARETDIRGQMENDPNLSREDAAARATGGDTAGWASMRAHRVADKYLPTAAIAKQYWDRYVGISPASMEGLGNQQGLSAQGGDVSGPLGIGLRTPFNNAALQGTKIWWDLQKRRSAAGYTGEQAQKNFEQLTQHGYYFGQGKYGPMADALQHITQFNPEIGQNDQTASMLDQTQRFGGMSLKSFVDTMKQVPDAARGARVSISQFVNDLNDWGHLNREQGGTFAGGVKSGIGFSNITGLPPSVGAALSQNQMVQGFGVQKYGLAPWQQGLLSGGQRVSATLDAVNTAYNAMGPQAGIKQGKDPLGFNQDVSGRDVQLANLHMLFPEASPEMLRKMTDPKYVRQTKARAGLDPAMDRWQGNVAYNQKVVAAHGNQKKANRLDELEKLRQSHHGHLPYSMQGEYDQLKGDLKKHPGIYSADQEKASRAQLGVDFGKKTEDQMRAQMRAAGFSKAEIHKVMKNPSGTDILHGQSVHPEDIAKKRYKKYQEIESKKAQNDLMNDPNVPKVWIGLKKHAAQALHISQDKAAATKNDYGAGGGSATVSPYGNAGPGVNNFNPNSSG